jgi:hypothetical protein
VAEVIIEDTQLAALQAAQKLLEQINGDPKTRPLLTKAIKAHYPNTRTEEDIAEEYAAPIREEVKSSISKMEEMMNKLAEREAKENETRTLSQMESAFSRLRKTYGYNDEGIDKIKALMVDRSIPDPDAAAALFERMNPVPVVTKSSWEPQTWDLKNNAVDTDLAGLFANPEKWGDEMVGKILLEERAKGAEA